MQMKISERGTVMEISLSRKKKDYADQLGGIANEFIKFIEKEFTDYNTYFIDKINKNVVSLLNVEKPKVMVYGIYNSGKSTLINSLCKEEVAEMADRPTTDKISEYDRGDYYLIDSPGVDAPIEHELVTEEYLNKCHVILFVISSKGIFEDRENYKKLENLIAKDIPFIIVLNERGTAVGKDWTEERKKQAKFDYDQEIKIIQYKIIQNLIQESNNKNIAEKYEVVVVNAKKALTGIIKNKPQLYDMSGVGFLEKRITQLLNNNASIAALFKQPISNLKECLNQTEKIITQTMSGNTSEDFGMRLHVLESKRDNIMQDLRILTQQAVNSHLEELTNSYVNGDADIFETIANIIFMEIDDRYTAKVNELLAYVDHNFQSLNLHIDTMSNLMLDSTGMTGSKLATKSEDEEGNETDAEGIPSEKKRYFDFLKSQRKREKEKLERLEREAAWKNQKAQYKVQEQIRRKQESRQLASSDLDELYRALNAIVTGGMDEKYDELISQIQQVDCLNKQLREDGERQMAKLRELRKKLGSIENSLR